MDYTPGSASRAKSSNGLADAEFRLGIGDGFLSVLLNPKIHSMILVMHSQFLDPLKPLSTQVVQLTAGFLLVCVAGHFPWIVGGQLILQRFRSARALRIQGLVFGVCMIAVAAYVAFGS